LNIAVSRTYRASTPTTNGPNDHALCNVPLRKRLAGVTRPSLRRG
jgi:hypothetical protein